MPTAPTIDDVLSLFERRGDSEYGGEPVTQLEHALQAAALAEMEGATPALIAAALLHDVGHLLHDLPVDAPDHGVDDRHESAAFNYLQQLFPQEVTEPVRLHVVAKRYLCAVDPDYQSTLSRPSVVSLELQGGPMSDAEAAHFRDVPFSQDAVRLRHWDDAAKVPQKQTPRLEHFAKYLHQVASTSESER